jgi:hypothetical protein
VLRLDVMHANGIQREATLLAPGFWTGARRQDCDQMLVEEGHEVGRETERSERVSLDTQIMGSATVLC